MMRAMVLLRENVLSRYSNLARAIYLDFTS